MMSCHHDDPLMLMLTSCSKPPNKDLRAPKCPNRTNKTRKKKRDFTASGSRGIAFEFFQFGKTRIPQNTVCFNDLSPAKAEKRRTLPHRAHASCFFTSLARTPPRAHPELQGIQWFYLAGVKNFDTQFSPKIGLQKVPNIHLQHVILRGMGGSS
jgi:hypothetical protein